MVRPATYGLIVLAIRVTRGLAPLMWSAVPGTALDCLSFGPAQSYSQRNKSDARPSIMSARFPVQ